MLPPLPPGAKSFPAMPGVTLSEFERLIARESDEVAAAFDSEGGLLLLPRWGTPYRVEFYEDEAESLRSAIVTHVHPRGGPLSGSDALFAVDNDVAEMRIVLPSGVLYRVLRPESGWPDAESMHEAAERHLEGIQRTVTMTEKEFERLRFLGQQNSFARIGVTMLKERWR